MLTYYATFSEVCKDENDTIFLSNTKSIVDVVYYSLGFALLPLFVSLGVNIRIVSLIFLPLALTMMIPMFLLKEKANENPDSVNTTTLIKSLKVSFANKNYIFWIFTTSILTVGLQLFLGGINEVFSTTGLNMTFVMASSFAPVPFTLILYRKVVKKYGIAAAFRYSLVIFSIGMLIMFLCCILHQHFDELTLTLIAIFGGISVSFALGSFFSITYTVPTNLAKRELDEKGNDVASMYFAVQGLFEGIAAGIATGFILVTLKKYDVIQLLPLIVILASAGTFIMTLKLPKAVSLIGKEEKEN
jgi:MFS family permease